MATTIPPPAGQPRFPAVLRVLASLTAGAAVGTAVFAAVTWMVLSAPLPAYLDYRSFESTAIAVGEGQWFWTTFYFLPGALWIAFATTVGIEVALWWQRDRSLRPVPVARGTLTAAWLVAVGFVAWSIPTRYHTPGRGPGEMVAWATREVGWSIGFGAMFFALVAAVITPVALAIVGEFGGRPPTTS